MSKPVCVVTGVGPAFGTGAEIARRFADGYRVAMIARNAANVRALAANLSGARAYPCDVADLDGFDPWQCADRILRIVEGGAAHSGGSHSA